MKLRVQQLTLDIIISVSDITDRILGWLTIANRRGDAVYTEADCDYFHLFAATAGTELKPCLDQYGFLYFVGPI